MATWQSARIQVRRQQTCEETVPQTSNDVVALISKVYCLCHLPEDGCFMIIVINGIMVTVQVSRHTLGRKWRMITRNIFVPAALQILRTLVSPASEVNPRIGMRRFCRHNF